MNFVYLMSLNLQKTDKTLTPDYSQKQWLYKHLDFQLKKNMALVLRYLPPANLKQVGWKSRILT